MSQKSLRILSYIIKAGLYILPILFLYVSSSLFFPFISGKNFFFRITVEVLLLLWVVLAVFSKNYRPKKSPILIALSATLFILVLATIFGENSYRSFWSNFERMEGLVGHIHLFAYFLILTSVFLKEKDWLWFFRSLVAAGVLVAGYAYLQLFKVLEIFQSDVRLEATLGNSTYLAIFIIFQLFLITLLFYKSQNRAVKWFFGVLFLLELPILYYTATRGAILGFIAGLVLFVVLMAVLNKSKDIRRISLGVLIGIVVLVSLFMGFKDSSFIRGSPVLGRLASISLEDGTVESRFTIWGMSMKGFAEKPILGWGPENYNLVFNKYFEPVLYKQEPWFDRAHNVFFDWLITAGALGLLAYLSIFAAALFVVWQGFFTRGESASGGRNFSLFESAAVTALFGAYGFHNLFVFDNLTSYMLFFSVLGYLHWKYITSEFGKTPSVEENSDIKITHYLIITIIFILTIFSLYFINLKPILAGSNLINTLQDINQRKPVEAILINFNKTIAYKTFASTETREQLAMFAGKSAGIGLSSEEQKKVFELAIIEMEEQVRVAPTDTRYYIFLGNLYKGAGNMASAEEAYKKALEFSPKKQHIYFAFADIYFAQNKNEDAFKMLETAYNLETTYKDAAKNLAIGAILTGRQEYAEKLLEKNYGSKVIANQQLVIAYAKVGNYEKVRDIWLEFIKQDPNNSQYRLSLAVSYLGLGQRQEAIGAIEKAIELTPDFKDQGEFYISEIRAGRNP